MNLDKDIAAYRWLRRGRRRRRILTRMAKAEEGIMPSQIADQLGLLLHRVCDSLRELRHENLAVVVNPEARSRRIYRITKRGQAALNEWTREHGPS